MRRLFHALSFFALASVCQAAELSVPDKPLYNRDVRPILADACFRCHGFDKNTREAGLRLDDRTAATSPHGSIIPIQPGDPGQSEVWARIITTDPDDVMPPPEAHRQLTDREREILRRWITQGAAYQDHWAYLPVEAVTPSAGPTTNAASQVIDQFLLARQQTVGVPHATEADRATLIRRVYLDLIGLPPDEEAVQTFINDPAPDAYDQVVNKLLLSEHYGERMAVWWLDLVRFADTIGYHSDNPRNIWPYRDYVIASFNANIPFDQFTREQIAGDLLPGADQRTLIASGYNRLLLTTEEGGAQAKQYEAKHLTDRVKSIGTTWLGQTYMCAECHDHKYDPVTAKDFYALGAFFADVQESAIGAREEGMAIYTEAQQAQRSALLAKLDQLQAEFNRPYTEEQLTQDLTPERLRALLQQDKVWTTLPPKKAKATKGNFRVKTPASHSITLAPDASRIARDQSDGREVLQVDLSLPARTSGLRVEFLKSAPGGVGHAGNGNLVLSEISLTMSSGQPIKLDTATASFEQPGYPAQHAIDGITDQSENGWAILGGTGAPQALHLSAKGGLSQERAQAATLTLAFNYGEQHVPAEIRISATSSTDPAQTIAHAPLDPALAKILRQSPQQWNKAQRGKVGAYLKETTPHLTPLRTQLQQTRQELTQLEQQAHRSLVTTSGPKRTVRLLPRGDWMDESGEITLPATPAYLPAALTSTTDHQPTRLDLANWLVDRRNPLTARVLVNRLWKQFYGIGLSKTLEDMGTQAEMPTHPELLDWLALEFMNSGWDVRHMVQLMVTSQAYRQSSIPTPEQLLKDPDNRLHTRASRWRLEAEGIRDNALSIAGLLVTKIGGPSAHPYQPPGYWENLNFPRREWANDHDENQWRRGLYTWWQRSTLHPGMMAFDAPSREECTAERIRSNIPQQALVLLNDPTYVEAARAFASHMWQSGSTPQERLQWGWRRATTRAPHPEELATLLALLDKHQTEYTQYPEAAAALLQTGLAPQPAGISAPELAAYASVARVLLNLHETITRH